MPIKTLTAPTLTAVISMADLRVHLKIDGTNPTDATAQDSQASAAFAAAHKYAQHYTQTSIGAQSLELACDLFPASGMQIPRGPVISITSVKYLDAAGTEITLDPSAYQVDLYGTPARLMPAYGTSWPSTRDTINAVKVVYVAGRDAADDALKYAMLLLAGNFFENREAVATGSLSEVPLGMRALLDTATDYSGGI